MSHTVFSLTSFGIMQTVMMTRVFSFQRFIKQQLVLEWKNEKATQIIARNSSGVMGSYGGRMPLR